MLLITSMNLNHQTILVEFICMDNSIVRYLSLFYNQFAIVKYYVNIMKCKYYDVAAVADLISVN